MTNSDHTLLEAITAALNAAPFAATVKVHGHAMSRPLARAMERMLLRSRMAERRKSA